MSRTVNREKVRKLNPNARTAVFALLWFALLGAAVLFIAVAGHI